MTKPPYRVPSMTEIADIPWNGKTIVSTFSGCGGSCLGFKMAGYRVAWASEFVPAAQDVYRLNHPDTILDTRDIRTVTGADILESIDMEIGEVDVLEGSPPCASFSTAGKRERGWGKVNKYSDVEQRSDDLFFEYIRLIDELKPKTFVAENVSGLVKGTAKGYFKLILKAMKDRGYRVEARLLDAQWLGVPQARQRIIFVGVREDIDRAPAFPTPLPYRYSVRDALPWIARVDLGGGFGSVETKDADSTPYQTVGTGPSAGNGLATQVEAIVGIEHANGFDGHAEYGADQPAPSASAGRPVRVAVRAIHDTSGDWSQGDITDRPSPAVTVGGLQSNACHFQIEEMTWDQQIVANDAFEPIFGSLDGEHPTILQSGESTSGEVRNSKTLERRKFTIAELRRICGFPDDFQLTGSYAQQWERLGRAVPPVMMAHVARVVRDEVLT